MRIWPEGGWFGLTKRNMLRILAFSTIALSVFYAGLRSYVAWEVTAAPNSWRHYPE